MTCPWGKTTSPGAPVTSPGGKPALDWRPIALAAALALIMGRK